VELAERYEQLRSRALDGRPDGFRLGLGVLLRGGMAAWMHAWDGMGPVARCAAPRPAGPPERAGEMVAVLAAMALARVGS